jgi:hypothetical protein
MSDWRERLTVRLEPLLSVPDPRRTEFCAYHDMPYAIFRYPPEAEFELRREVSLLRTRLVQRGKRVTVVSLATLLWEILAKDAPVAELAQVEKDVGIEPTIAQVHSVLTEIDPLPAAFMKKVPEDADPLRDVIFILRVGALFPVYRTSVLVEQLHRKLLIPSVLFFPGDLDGPAGLRFMGVFPPEHNYRPRIF